MTRVRLAALVAVVAAVTGAGIALAFSPQGSQARPALGTMHGQASWRAGERAAPPFALRDQDGNGVSRASLRGRPVLLTFLDSRCVDQCPVAGRMLGTMLSQMRKSERPTVVVVSVNPKGDTPASIRRAMADWELAGDWRWHWLGGTRAELSRVWGDYGLTVQPTSNDITHGMQLYLIDRHGFQRAGYLFPFLPNFVALDLETLAREGT
jgi:cytochrome oxidase Cu insertion factor (SCO1/SenC/PrrC family)